MALEGHYSWRSLHFPASIYERFPHALCVIPCSHRLRSAKPVKFMPADTRFTPFTGTGRNVRSPPLRSAQLPRRQTLTLISDAFCTLFLDTFLA